MERYFDPLASWTSDDDAALREALRDDASLRAAFDRRRAAIRLAVGGELHEASGHERRRMFEAIMGQVAPSTGGSLGRVNARWQWPAAAVGAATAAVASVVLLTGLPRVSGHDASAGLRARGGVAPAAVGVQIVAVDDRDKGVEEDLAPGRVTPIDDAYLRFDLRCPPGETFYAAVVAIYGDAHVETWMPAQDARRPVSVACQEFAVPLPDELRPDEAVRVVFVASPHPFDPQRFRQALAERVTSLRAQRDVRADAQWATKWAGEGSAAVARDVRPGAASTEDLQ